MTVQPISLTSLKSYHPVLKTQEHIAKAVPVKEIPKASILSSLIKKSETNCLARALIGSIGLIGFGSSYILKTLGIELGFDKKIEALQNSFLFRPTQESFPSPDRLKTNFEEIVLDTPNEPKLHGYFFEKEKSDSVIIYLHGYSGIADECFPECLKIQEYIPASVLIMDYRGFGKSEGTPTRKGVVTDALRMYNLMKEKGFKDKNIILYGVSLGGGIAFETANELRKQKENIGALVSLYSFSSVKDICNWRFPHIPSCFVIDDLFNGKNLIRKLNIPVFIAHGDKDLKTPLTQSLRLFKNANKPKELYVFPELGHEDLNPLPKERIEGYFNALRKFLEKNMFA